MTAVTIGRLFLTNMTLKLGWSQPSIVNAKAQNNICELRRMVGYCGL